MKVMKAADTTTGVVTFLAAIPGIRLGLLEPFHTTEISNTPSIQHRLFILFSIWLGDERKEILA